MDSAARPGTPGRPRNSSQAKPKRRQWWHYLIAAAGALTLIGLAYAAYAIWFSLTHVRATYARVSGLVVTVSAKTDTRVKRILVGTGDRVEKEQIVVLLDNADLEAEVERAKANLSAAQSTLASSEADLELTIMQSAATSHEADAELAAAQARLAQAEAEREMESLQQPDEVKQAQAELEAARARLTRMESGPRAQEIEQGRAELRGAQAEFARATSTRLRMEKLFEQGAISEQALDTARTTEQVADSAVAVARERLSLLQAGNRPEDIDSARQAVAAAEAALAVSRASALEGHMKEHVVQTRKAEARYASAGVESARTGNRRVALKEQDVLSRRAAVDETRAALAAASARLSETELRSTVNGVVVRGPGSAIHENEVVTKGLPIVTVVSTDQALWISGSISELYAHLIKPGQSANVKIDAYGWRSFPAVVAEVGGATEFPAAGQDSPWMLRQVPIKLHLTSTDVPLIPGMSCRVWIDTRRGGNQSGQPGRTPPD